MDDDRPTDPNERTDPTWKRDFPYEAAAEEDVTRREFARYLVAGAGVMAVGNLGLAAWTQLRTINTGEPRKLIPLADGAVGDTYLFSYPADDDPAILLRLAEREVVAFSQKCTHLGCVVYFERAREQMICPCHEGVFEARSGLVVAGPPQRPLVRIAIESRADGMIWTLAQELA